ncbi:major facilitator superfamily domain-containing protein [Xylogone sp. PMI_703]|nr:major facilitator superfamily domain-containing protein [Xylogone sp. PMI_703]
MDILHESGLISVIRSRKDTKFLLLLRFFRFFAFGGSTIVLALYLHALNISDAYIGLFMSLTLLGDVSSFFLALFADKIGRRAVLAVGNSLMVLSGCVFASSGSYWLIMTVGIIGVISPNGREIGPFSAVEESILAQLTPKEQRSDIFAWYALTGSVGAAMGKFVIGWVVQRFLYLGWEEKQAYRATFGIYAGLGILELMFVLGLSARVELNNAEKLDTAECEALLAPDEEGEIDNPVREALSGTAAERPVESIRRKWRLLPGVKKESYRHVSRFCLLFAIDSLASGLVPASWVTYFFHTKFSVTPSGLGTIFSIGAVLSAISAIPGASLAKRIGLVPTMVFTHLPSAIALALIPLFPSLSLSIFFLLLRFALGSVDIAPKAAFLSVVFQPSERTGILGLINVVRTGSQSLGPLITGAMSLSGKGWLPFVLAGGLKVAYDMALFIMYSEYESDNAENREH